ncbi:copper resistance protein CopC [Streptomyces cacaoi]
MLSFPTVRRRRATPATLPARRLRRAGALLTAVQAVVVGALALFAVVGVASPASAHAALTASDPAEGSVVRGAPPRQVTLTFSEGVAMSDGSVRVLDPQGKRVDKGKVRTPGTSEGVQRAVGLKSGLAQGTYTVAWQAVSADSHPVSGAFTFSVGKKSSTTAKVPEQNDHGGPGAVDSLYGIARYAAYAGFVLLVGGGAFVLLCAPRAASARSVQRVTVTGWITLTASTLLLLLLRNPYTTTGKLADVFDLGGLRDVVATKPGAALVSRLLLLGAAALFVAVLFGSYARRTAAEDGPGKEPESGPADRRDLSFGLAVGGTVVAAGLAATWAMAEHASTGIQTGLAMPLDVLHLLAMALWLGGLVALGALLLRGPAPSRAAAQRFSRVAFTSVTVLAATGLYQSWRQVGSFDALTGTAYGQLLIAKVCLVAVLVGLGWFSRRWTARLTDTPAPVPAGRRPAHDTATATRRTPAADRRGADGGSGPGSDAASASASGSGSGSAPEADSDADTASGDPVRAAQLARQRAVLNAARRRQERDADAERSGLRRSVLIETGVAVVLLVVTTVLTTTEPARTEEAVRAKGGAAQQRSGPLELKVPYDTGGDGGKGTARLRFSPGNAGDNTLDLRATDPSGEPVPAPEVKVSLTLPAKDIGPLPVTPKPVPGEKGHWKAKGVQLPMAGKWRIAVTVRTSDIDMVTETRTATIG